MLKYEPKLAIVAVHTEENEPPKVQESPEKILFKPVERSRKLLRRPRSSRAKNSMEANEL